MWLVLVCSWLHNNSWQTSNDLNARNIFLAELQAQAFVKVESKRAKIIKLAHQLHLVSEEKAN